MTDLDSPIDRDERSDPATPRGPDALSRVLVLLLKGAVSRGDDARVWGDLVQLQTRVRDFVSVLGLELVIDDSEGYAFVRSVDRQDDDAKAGEVAVKPLPRLVARRQLSFPVSLLLALLRRSLVEFDARGGDTRLVLGRDQIIELVRVFLPDRSDEARLFAQIDAHIAKVIEMGFLKRLGGATSANSPSFEVQRILKAFVDAQWLTELDARLAVYRDALERDTAEATDRPKRKATDAG